MRHLTERAGVASMNKHQTNILVGVLLGSLLAVAILLFPVFLMVGNEIYGRYEAKKQLNNPYINQHYVDWSKISLSQSHGIDCTHRKAPAPFERD